MGREEWSMTERKKLCRDCYKELTERGARLGVCRNCAGKEVKKLRKRLIVSFLVGDALVGSVLAFRNHICSVYYFQKPGGDVVVPLFFGNVLVNDQFFFDMFYPSRTGGILFLAICFFAPFSSFIRIDYPTFRHQAELDMLKMEPFTAKYAASSNHQRQDDVGIFLVSCILSAVSGPFLFVYRIYRLVRLSAALKRGDW